MHKSSSNIMPSKYENVYEFDEDSKLLLECSLREIEKLKKNNLKICEVGVGSGFVISNIAEIYSKNSYFGCDINPYAVDLTTEELSKTKIKFEILESDLLSYFNQKFDVILFNAPYLPFENKSDSFQNLSIKDRAIYGGKKGYEVALKLIYQINDKLNNDGICLIIISSQTNLDYIKERIEENFFECELLENKNSFFEKIHCIKITKSEVLKELTDKGITQIKYLDCGKHSKVLEGIYSKNPVIIKIGKSQHIQKEIAFEKKLENESFVPKMFFYEDNFVIREKIEGELIIDFFENCKSKEVLIKILNKILDATIRLDELGINKFEMINPYKHIYILDNEDIKFIDFERCIYTDKPKNTTQVLEFFRRNFQLLLKNNVRIDENKIFSISKKYKKKNFIFGIEEVLCK